MSPNSKWSKLIRPLVVALLFGICAVSARADAPAGRYDTLTTTTLRDSVTGLTWRRDVSATDLTQTAAVTYCTGLGGGWRLPTVFELASIVEEGRVSPSIDVSAFPGTPNASFWSNSSYAGAAGVGWAVGFFAGDVFTNVVSSSYRARCVR